MVIDKLKYNPISLVTTPTWLTIGAGIILVLWQQLIGYIPPSVQIAFFAFFIAFTGIPHGAVDHLVEKETNKRLNKQFSLLSFLAKYLLTMLIYALAWFFLPSISLLFFILISAWHFGETDVENAPSTLYWNVVRFTFGCFVLFWILLFHSSEVTPVLERISNNNIVVAIVWSKLLAIKSVFLLTLGLITSIFTYLAYQNQPIYVDKIRFLKLALVIVLTYFLPLLPAFALYFGGWHALCSLSNIHTYLMQMRENSSHESSSDFLKTWSKTLPFTILAFLFMGLAGWYWLNFYPTWDALPLLFIFLSLITLPHLNIMHRMSKATVYADLRT
jgi:beta-carotene 15,15'-dioxygenase